MSLSSLHPGIAARAVVHPARHVSAWIVLLVTAALCLAVPPVRGQSAIPTLLDPALQACLDDEVASNGWQTADEVTALHCSDRGVVRLDGVAELFALTELDVSDNFLHDISPLSVFEGLIKLDLSGNERVPVSGISGIANIVAFNGGLTHLGLDDISIGDLARLPFLDTFGDPIGLLELKVSNTGIRELFHLSNYPTLRAVDLSDNPVTADELFWLGLLPSIEELDLSRTEVVALEPLTAIQTLTHLDLSGIALSEFDLPQIQSVLAQNGGITHLGLSDLPIRDLSLFRLYDGNLTPLPLIELDLNRTQITDITPLNEFPLLRNLELAGNAIVDLSPLSSIVGMSELDLSDNALSDLTPLQGLSSLERLDLSRNPLLTASSLVPIVMNNPDLSHLALASIPIQDLSTVLLSGPQALPLIDLDVSDTGIDGNSLLVLRSGLEVLNVANNQITDLTNMASLVANLRKLDVSQNQLTSLSTLAIPFGSRLQRLEAAGNANVDSESLKLAIQRSPRLTHLGLRDVPIQSLSTFFPATPLARPMIELDLGNTQLHSSELVGLSELFFLRVLKLDGNQLEELDALAPLERLEALDLSGNENLDALRVFDVLFRNRNGLERLGLADIPLGMDLFTLFPLLDDQGESRLAELDLRNTGILDLLPLAPQSTLKRLNLADNRIVDVFPLFGPFQFEQVSLLGNEEIPCPDLDALELALGPDVLVRPLQCGRKPPPVLDVFSPMPDFIYPGGDEVPLGALAMDEQDGDLSPFIEWASDRDGLLGSGDFLLVRLSGGSHRISASVTNSAGETTTVSVDIVVSNQPPVAIVVPSQRIELGMPAILDGTASIDPDGDPLSFLWTDSDGLVVGDSATVPLLLAGVGDYDFTLTVRDAPGDSSQATTRIEVRDTLAPAVTLIAPAEVPAGKPLPIEWTAADPGGIMESSVSFSSDGGVSYVAVSECSGLAADVRSCTWEAPGPATPFGSLRIAVGDVSGNVAIVDRPLTVLAVETTEIRIDASFDDAQEGRSGFTRLRSRRLRFFDRNLVGVRFAHVGVPRDALIVSARVEFVAARNGVTSTPIQVVGEATGNASEFARRRFDISSREVTVNEVAWTPTSWTTGEVANTPDVGDIIEEIVTRPDWADQNALVLMFATSGRARIHAQAFDLNPSHAPVLKIEFARRGR